MSKATKADTPQKVNYNDAVAESKKYFDGDDLAATVWVSKYALKDSFGNIYEKSPREMHERIASEIERIEQKYPNPLPKEEVFALLDHFRYVIPQGGPMTGIGNNFCFQLMELGIQYLMRNALLRKHTGKLLRCLNRNCTNQYRLLLCMGFLYGFHNGMELFFSGFIYGIL